jgi:hypothetical protein
MTCKEFVDKHGIIFSSRRAASNPNLKTDEPWHATANHWRVTIRKNGSNDKATFHCSQGSAITERPKLETVLECLILDASAGCETFGTFCDDMGYDEDPRRAYRTWEACRKTEAKLRQFLGERAMKEALNIIWD